MASLLKTSLWILKSQGRNNKLISHQENIFQEPVWITTTHKANNKFKKLKVKNKTIKWDTAKISDLKIKMYCHIWIIEYNNQRIYWHQAMDKRWRRWWIMVAKILHCRIRGKAKVLGDNHTIRFINNNNQIKAQSEETRIKFLATRCYKTISLFKIQARLLNNKCGNRDMLRKTK